MTEADRELVHEMNAPHFKTYDPTRPWVLVTKDYDEGSAAMWHEHSRYETQDDARDAMRCQREYVDNNMIESLVAYKVVEDGSC